LAWLAVFGLSRWPVKVTVLALVSTTTSLERAVRYTRIAGEISQSVTRYMLGDVLTSLITGIVVFVTLTVLGVPFALLWALWVALVDYLPMVGGALAGIPLFCSLSATRSPQASSRPPCSSATSRWKTTC
jgi:predicted PurR-regulated permease PerM